MKKKMIALVCAAMMLVSTAFATTGGDLRASEYLDSYLVQLIPKGGGNMSVSYGVYGTGKIAKIGVEKIIVEEQLITGRWVKAETYLSSERDDFYSNNANYHLGSISFVGLPGTNYRVVMTVYGGPTSGSGDTRTITSLEAVCT